MSSQKGNGQSVVRKQTLESDSEIKTLCDLASNETLLLLSQRHTLLYVDCFN